MEQRMSNRMQSRSFGEMWSRKVVVKIRGLMERRVVAGNKSRRRMRRI